MPLHQLGPYCRDSDYRAEVCVRVVIRFLVDDHRRLRRYLDRPDGCLRTLVGVVATRAAIDLARSMRENVAGRGEPTFRWVSKVELSELHGASTMRTHELAELSDAIHYLETHADPVDVELLRCSIGTRKNWLDIARAHDLTPDAARQRVYRLRRSLRSWLERHAQ